VDRSSEHTRTQLLFFPEQKGSISLRNGGFNIHIYTMSTPRRLSFEQYPKWQPDKDSNVTQVKDRILRRRKRREKRRKFRTLQWDTALITGGGEKIDFVALKIEKQYSLALLVTLRWGQVALGSEKDKVTGDWIVSLFCRGKKLNNGANFEQSLNF
jgi:hypothetical protein